MPQINGWSEDEIEQRSNTLAAKIQRAWQRVVRLIFSNGGSGPEGAITLSDLNDLPNMWSQQLDGDVIGYVGQILLEGAEQVRDEATAAGLDVSGAGFELTEDFIEEYIKLATNRLVGIGNDVWVTTKGHLLEAYKLGESSAQIAARVKHVTGVSDARAMTIARTEIHAALEAGSYEQAMLVDPNGKKKWLATEDSHTRPTHREADGQEVSLAAPFIVGGAPLAYPGDPSGPPGETINCRCTTLYELDPESMSDEDLMQLLDQDSVVAATRKWEPTEHPRGKDGKFISKANPLFNVLSTISNDMSNSDLFDALETANLLDWEKLTPEQKKHVKSQADAFGDPTLSAQFKKFETLSPIAAPTVQPLKHTGKKFVPATIYKPHEHNDIIAVSDDGMKRLQWNAPSKKYFQQELSSSGNWLTKAGLTKKDAYNLVQTSDWYVPSSKKDNTLTPATPTTPVGISYIPSQAINTNAPEPPKAPTKFIASFTNAVPGDVYKDQKDNAIIAITSSNDQRLRWDATEKKYAFEKSNDKGATWYLSSMMTKKAAYDLLKPHKNTGIWRKPKEIKVATVTAITTPTPTAPIPSPIPSPISGFTPKYPPGSIDAVVHATAPNGATFTFKQKAEQGVSQSPIYVDPVGQRWLLKNPWTSTDHSNFDLDMASNKLQTLMGLKGPATYKVTGPDGKPYVAQAMFDAKDAFPNGKFDPNKLAVSDVIDMQRQQVLDWLIGNNDAHSGNFLRLPNGEITGIDKGHALRFYAKDKLTPDYKPWSPTGTNKNTYPDMWKAYENGESIVMHDPNQGDVGNTIKKTMAIPDDELKDLFRPYVEQAVKHNRFPDYGNDTEKVLNAIVSRKNNLAKDFAKLYDDTTKKRNDKLKKDIPALNLPEKDFTPAEQDAIPKSFTDFANKTIGASSGDVLATGVNAQGKKVKLTKGDLSTAGSTFVYWEEKPYTSTGFEKISTHKMTDAPAFWKNKASVINWDVDKDNNLVVPTAASQPMMTMHEFFVNDVIDSFDKAPNKAVLAIGWEKDGTAVQIRKGSNGYLFYSQKVGEPDFVFEEAWTPNLFKAYMISPQGKAIKWNTGHLTSDYQQYVAAHPDGSKATSTLTSVDTNNVVKTFSAADIITDWQSVYDSAQLKLTGTPLAYTTDGAFQLAYFHGSGMLGVSEKQSNGKFAIAEYINPNKFDFGSDINAFGTWVKPESLTNPSTTPTYVSTSSDVLSSQDDWDKLAALGKKQNDPGLTLAYTSDGHFKITHTTGQFYTLHKKNATDGYYYPYTNEHINDLPKDTKYGSWVKSDQVKTLESLTPPSLTPSSKATASDILNAYHLNTKNGQVIATGTSSDGSKWTVQVSPSNGYTLYITKDGTIWNTSYGIDLVGNLNKIPENVDWSLGSTPSAPKDLPIKSPSPKVATTPEDLWDFKGNVLPGQTFAAYKDNNNVVYSLMSSGGTVKIFSQSPFDSMPVLSEYVYSADEIDTWLNKKGFTSSNFVIESPTTSSPSTLSTPSISSSVQDDILKAFHTKLMHDEGKFATGVTPSGDTWTLHVENGKISGLKNGIHIMKWDESAFKLALIQPPLNNATWTFDVTPTTPAAPSVPTPPKPSSFNTLNLADGTQVAKGSKIKVWGPYTKKGQYPKYKTTVIAYRANGQERIVYSHGYSISVFRKQRWDPDKNGWVNVQTEQSKLASLAPSGTIWYKADTAPAGVFTTTPKPSSSSSSSSGGVINAPAKNFATPTAEQIEATLDTSTLASVSDSEKQTIFTKFKALPSTYLSSDPNSLLSAAKTVAASHGVSKLTVLQIIDEQSAKKAGVANNNSYENKVVEWLKTPAGYAKAHGIKVVPPTPDFVDDKVGHHLIPSFEDSNHFTYKTPSLSFAANTWDDMLKAHGSPITSSQAAGVKSYTGNSTYGSINGYLWGDYSTITTNHHNIMNNIQKAMRPSVVPMLFTRGVGFNALGVSSHAELQNLIGETRVSEGFNSAGVEGFSFGGNVKLEIEAPPGTPMVWAKSVSHYPHEKEMLLAAGLHYKIISVTPPSGYGPSIVRVRVVPPPIAGDAGHITASIRFER